MPLTYKNKFNAKYGFEKNTPHSVAEISKLSGFNKKGLDVILSKGQGAYYSNSASVRPTVHSATQWGLARIYSGIMGGKAAKVDAKHLY